MNDKQLIIIKGLEGPKKIDLDRIHRVIDWAAEGLDNISVSQDGVVGLILHPFLTSGSALVYSQNNLLLLRQQEAPCATHDKASIIAIIYRALSAVRVTGNEVITQLLLTCGHIARAPPHENHFFYVIEPRY